MEKRPWGTYELLLTEPSYQVKRIVINPGLRLSLQKHLRRSEMWTIVSGAGLVTLDEDEISVHPGSVINVSVGQVHRIHNTGTQPLVFIEVQVGDYFGEDDIIRLHDDFGRL